MEPLHRIKNWVFTLFGYGRKNSELEEEIESHIAMRTEMNIDAGMTPEVARRNAVKSFGNVELLKEDCRDSWCVRVVVDLMCDFRFGLRLLWKSKGFTVAVMLTLAICLAGNTIVFSVLDAVLSPPPIPRPDRVVQVYDIYPGIEGSHDWLGGDSCKVAFQEYLEKADTFESLSLVLRDDVNVSIGDAATRSSRLSVSMGFFDVVGIRPILGRAFRDEDYHMGSQVGGATEELSPILLAESFWKNRMGGSLDVLGKTVYVRGGANTVVGVVPDELGLMFSDPQIYRPWKQAHEGYNPNYGGSAEDQKFWRYIKYGELWGRLKDGVSMGQAKAQIDALDRRFHDRAPTVYRDYKIRSRHETRLATSKQIAKSKIGNSLYLLQTSVLIVLLIGCMNVASLLVARSVGRQSEFAVRGALGASRYVLARQMLMECMALTLGSCMLSVLIAWPAFSLTSKFLLVDLITFTSIDSLFSGGSSLFFFVGISLGVGLLLALFSSLSFIDSRRNMLASIHEGSSNTTASKSFRSLKSALVSAQVALTVVLLTGAVLLMQSFLKAIHTDPGIDTENVYVSKLNLTAKTWYSKERKGEFRTRLMASMLEIPGVESVALASSLPIVDALATLANYSLTGSSVDLENSGVVFRKGNVSTEYFELLGIKLLRGRLFDASDAQRNEVTYIVDRAFAEKYYKDLDPIGQYLYYSGFIDSGGTEQFDLANAPLIVGVVENVKHDGLDNLHADSGVKDMPMVYVSFFKRSQDIQYSLLIKTKGTHNDLLPLAREKLTKIVPGVPLYLNMPLNSWVRGTLDNRRAFMLLIAILSSMALLLSAVGIYGVLAYDVIQRTREIGLRMALGSTKGGILRLFMRQGATKVLVGLFVGLLGAFVLSDRIAEFLFEVDPTEPLAFLLVAVFVVVIASIASYLPARKALRIQPMEALRVE